VEVDRAPSAEFDDWIGTQVCVADGKNLDEMFCAGFGAKAKNNRMTPSNIDPINLTCGDCIICSDNNYINCVSTLMARIL